ncbi:hypothetical protein Taro_020404 [Colocasia esculenta]|uniref:Uncharacterized protein n=1 Tax=Colocasia esculenta TaxID=4460 RepID=A0A843V543_COLES|nr:hypothetical protein [Colocasia esculenta]
MSSTGPGEGPEEDEAPAEDAGGTSEIGGGRYNTQLGWSSFTPEGNNTTLDTPPGLPSQLKGNSTLDTTRSSFTTEGKQHPGYYQVFLHNRMETTQEKENDFKPLDQAFNKPRSEATSTESKDLNKAHSQNYTSSLGKSITAQRAKS